MKTFLPYKYYYVTATVLAQHIVVNKTITRKTAKRYYSVIEVC